MITKKNLIKIPLLLLMIGVALFVVACADKEEKVQSHLDKGQAYFEKGELAEAIIELKSAAQLAPKNAKARYALGKVLLENKEFKASFRELSIAASLDADNLDAQYQVATVLFLGKRYDECRTKLGAILERDPDYFDGLVLLANLNMVTNNLRAALSAVDKAIIQRSDDAKLFILRGTILEKDSDFEGAEQSLKKAVLFGPKEIVNYQALAMFYVIRKNADAAEKVFKAMISAMPDSSQALLTQAGFYESIKEYDRVEKPLKEAVALDPGRSDLVVVLASYYERHNLFLKAEQAYMDAMKISETPLNIEGLLANLYYESAQFERARKIVEKILSEEKENLNGQLVKAKLLLRDGSTDEALSFVEKVIKAQPKSAEAFFVKALAYSRRGNGELAFAAANEAVKYDHQHYRARLLLADLFLRDGAPLDAKREAAAVLRIVPGNLRAAFVVAKCLILENDFDRALEILDKLQEVAPNDSRLYLTRAVAFSRKGTTDKAIVQFEKVLELSPESDVALGGIVGILVKMNKVNEAISRVKKQLVKYPDVSRFHILAGNLAFSTGEYARAERSFKKAIELSPEVAKPYVMLAAILQKSGQIQGAIDQYRASLAENSGLDRVRMQLGALLEKQGNVEDAAAEYRGILKRNPKFVPAANRLAWYMAENDPDLGEALRLAMVAKSGAPDDPYVADTVGWVHYKRGSYALAKTQFVQSLEKLGENPTVNYHLGLALVRLSKKQKAKESLRRAIELEENGNFPEIDQARKLLAELSG